MGIDFWTKAIIIVTVNASIVSNNIGGISPHGTRKGKIRPRYEYVAAHTILILRWMGILLEEKYCWLTAPSLPHHNP